MVQMLGWLSADAARASRSNRFSAMASFVTDSGRNFRATTRPSLVSSAAYTTPMPPPPSLRCTWKCEMVLPMMSASPLLGLLAAIVSKRCRDKFHCPVFFQRDSTAPQYLSPVLPSNFHGYSTSGEAKAITSQVSKDSVSTCQESPHSSGYGATEERAGKASRTQEQRTRHHHRDERLGQSIRPQGL